MNERMSNEISMNEVSAVGSFLIDPEALTPLREIVKADDFESPYCRRIFETACRMQDENETVDIATVSGRLNDIPSSFFREALDYTASPSAVRDYGEAIHKAALRRNIRTLGMQLAELPPNADPYEAINDAETELNSYGYSSSGLIVPSEQLLDYNKYLTDISFGDRKAVVPTGFASLDAILGGGMVYGGMYVGAARPGVGKTTFALKAAENVARNGLGVLYISLEMTREEITPRRIANECGMPIQLLTHEGLPKEKQAAWDEYTRASIALESRPFYLSDRPQQTLAEIQMMARRVDNLGLIVIDYIGLLKQDEGRSLYEKMTATSNGIKRMAMALKVPILALAQLNRESEHNGGSVPKLSELRDSGAIEQDADAVILLSRVSQEKDALSTTILRADVAKNRHGKIGSTQLKLWGINGRMFDWPEKKGACAV